MHNFLIMGIPAKELKGQFNEKMLNAYVEKVLGKYIGNKCDYFQIGGRWQGVLGAKKSNPNVLLTETGCFEENYDFFGRYDALENNGASGPYMIDGVEFVPVNGGLVNEIEWDVIPRFMEYATYIVKKHILERDPRFEILPDEYKYQDGDLYLDVPDHGLHLLIKNGETFLEYAQRQECVFVRDFIPPHAYVDLDGAWHDDNEVWEELGKGLLAEGEMPENIMEFASNEFRTRVHNFLDTLQPGDGVVIVDFHV